MKKILFVAASAVLLAAGCQKTEIINPVGEPAMQFTAKMGKLTKADDTTPAKDASNGMENLQNQNFKVWAYTAFADPINGIEPGMPHSEMEGILVEYKEGKWSTEKEYYWPGTGKYLNFFALSTGVESPSVSFENKGSDLEDTLSKSMIITDYTVDHENPIDDLMVADFVYQSQEDEKNVSLKFRHALSKVDFLFVTRQDDAENYRKVVVEEVVVEKLNTKSTLTVSEVAGADSLITYKPSWGDRSVSQSFVETKDSFELSDTVKTFASWLVLPQQIGLTGEDDVIEEDLTVKISFRMGENDTEQISFNLATKDLKEWKPNQYIKYTVNITPNLIKFVPEVEDWDVITPEEEQN